MQPQPVPQRQQQQLAPNAASPLLAPDAAALPAGGPPAAVGAVGSSSDGQALIRRVRELEHRLKSVVEVNERLDSIQRRRSFYELLEPARPSVPRRPAPVLARASLNPGGCRW